MEPIKVLLITGWGRSGSTILASLLGQLDGFLSVGELRHVWDRGLLMNTPCACERSFRDCELWSRAGHDLIQAPRTDIERIVALRESFRTKDYLKEMVFGKPARSNPRLIEYAGHLGQIYRALREATGCRVIVDSSKLLAHGYVCRMIPEIAIHVLHLIRDPRAVAFSWRRLKVYAHRDGAEPQYMRQRGPLNSSLHWLVRNSLVEHMWSDYARSGQYKRLRYEDFVRAPRETIKEIRNFVGEDSPLDFFLDSTTAIMARTHEVSGNPSRYSSGTIQIKPDTQWISEMAWKERLWASVVALPMLHRYGYSTWGGPVSDDAAVRAPSSNAPDSG